MNSVLSLELAAQVGALLGTSALIYLVTHPNRKNNSARSHGNGDDDGADEVTTTPAPEDLRGMKRYSSYHRIRYHSTTANSNHAMPSSAASLTVS